MQTTRRIGAEDSPTRAMLLDAAESIMRDEGYGAVTSRKVSGKVGLKNQLVHYYFRTMDDLFLAVHRRLAESFLEMLETALAAENPVRVLWELASHRQSAAIEMEFMALANHRHEIRASLAEQLERYRARGVEAVTSYLENRGVDPVFSPLALSVLTSSLGRHMVLEESLGVTSGHPDTRALVEHFLEKLEHLSSPVR